MKISHTVPRHHSWVYKFGVTVAITQCLSSANLPFPHTPHSSPLIPKCFHQIAFAIHANSNQLSLRQRQMFPKSLLICKYLADSMVNI